MVWCLYINSAMVKQMKTTEFLDVYIKDDLS